jgi:PAS domain S-box-containing protein
MSRRLEDSLALLETVFAGAPVGLAFLDHDLRYIHINEALARRHGVSIADHIGKTLAEVVPDLAPRLEPLYREVLRTGAPVHDEPITAIRPGSSEPGHFIASYYPVQNSLGETLGVGAVVVDVTERTRAEEALRESEERYRTIVQTANEGIWLVDLEGRTLYLNHHMAEMLGVEPASIIGRPVTDSCFPEDVAAARERIASNLAGNYEQFDFRFRHQDGHAVHVLACTSPVRDAHGTVTGALGMFTDLTERRRTEEAQRFLAEVGAILTSSLDDEAMLRGLADLAVRQVADYAVIDLVENSGPIRRLHVASADPRNEDFARRLLADPPGNDPNRRTAMVLRTGEPILADSVDAEWIAKTGDPERIRLLQDMGLQSIIMAPLLARGQAIGVLTLVSSSPIRRYGPADLALAQELGRRAALAVENTRLRHQAEEALRTRDQFLAVVSHDLKNPIASIQLYTQMIRRAANRNRLDMETVIEDLDPIELATRRMIALIDELMDVARLEMGRPLPLHPKPVDVIALARQLVEEHQRGTDDCRVVLETSLSELVGYWDAPRIERALDNLLSNAVKYSPDGGDVVVTITNGPGQWAVISVRDHGAGIDPDDVARIFEPFQRGERSRPDVPGIGIGLTSARQIAERHGGSITVESAPGQGSTFTIRLPTSQAKQDSAG